MGILCKGVWLLMKIAVLVSGGVDSSVALRLLQEQYGEHCELVAFYLKIWLEDELSYLGDCPWEQDLAYVRAVCEQARVPLQVVSLQKEYHERVVAYTIAAIKRGETPNPDMMCNTFIKFGAFYDSIGKEYDAVATGHYAHIVQENGVWYLHRTPDALKDQTYFLAHLSQEQLARALFPLGKITKQEVRALAQQYDLCNKERKDSQGLCFLGKIKFHDFVKHHMGEKQGLFIEYETGEKWGEHQGFWFYTIGQRQGIGLSHGPWYVVAKDVQKNVVYISRNYYSADKKRDRFRIDQENWFAGSVPILHAHNEYACQVKVRHGAALVDCVIIDKATHREITLQTSDQGIAVGQFAVFYDGMKCLGSARIAGIDDEK